MDLGVKDFHQEKKVDAKSWRPICQSPFSLGFCHLFYHFKFELVSNLIEDEVHQDERCKIKRRAIYFQCILSFHLNFFFFPMPKESGKRVGIHPLALAPHLLDST